MKFQWGGADRQAEGDLGSGKITKRNAVFEV